jgi:hypothetical protein
MSYAFPSESYITNITKDKNVKLIKREGTQIIDDEGEVIGVNNVMINEFNRLEKPPIIDSNYWIKASYLQKKKMAEHWKNVPNDWYLLSCSFTEEDADRRNIGKLKKIKLNGKRVRVSKDDNCPDGQCIGTPRPSFNFCHLHLNISDDSSTNDNKSPHLSLVENNHIPRCNSNVKILILKKWQNPTGSTEYKVSPGCGPCKEWFRVAYKCETTPEYDFITMTLKKKKKKGNKNKSISCFQTILRC